MKKWFKYLLVLCVLLCSTSIAMAQYVTIGTGTTTQDKLFYTTFEDVRSLLTFSNTELTTASPSLNQGDTIYSIGWYVQSLGSQVMYGATIKIRESGAPVTVWIGRLAPIIGWNDILLDVPYIRIGTGNLIIEYCFDNCEFIQQSFNVRRTNTPSNTNQFFCSDDQSGCSLTATSLFYGNGSGSYNDNQRPNTRFGKSVPGATFTHDTLCSGTSTSVTFTSSSSVSTYTSVPGFTYYGNTLGRYYFKSTLPDAWLLADLKCQQVGGHLAHISNQAENNYVDNIISTLSPTRGWIGLQQNCNSGSFSEPAGGWEWTDGTPVTYTNWDAGEPNNYFGSSDPEDYVEMDVNGQWNDHTNPGEPPGGYVLEIEETYLWNTGATTSSITVSPTATTTYWVDHSFGTNTEREYFIVNVGVCGCTDPSATNYNSLATIDDGSCITCVYGCTDNTACNYDPLATCDDASCVYDVSIVTATNVCSGVCDGEVSVAVSPITPGTNYTYTINGGSVIPYLTNTNSLCAGNHSYEFFIDGISCGVETIIIGEYPAMTLQTTAVDSTCDSSYAFVSASVASSSGGNISTLTYCNSSPGILDYNNIELVRLVGDGDSIVKNTSGACDDYTDYTTTDYTTLTPGQSYSVEVNTGYCSSSSQGGDSIKVFIDWNIDGDFDDTGEVVGASFSSSTFSFIVPTNASYGATRMRVVSQYQSPNPTFPSGPVGPCDVGIFSGSYPQPWYGATEDYSIVISSTATLANTTYLWSNGDTDSITNSLVAGQYTVIVTDANGCEATDTVSVGQSFQVQIDSLIANPDSPCSGDIITLTAYPSSLSYEYKFKWRDSGTSWTNISGFGGWLNNNTNPQYGPIYQDTDFRVKIRSSIDNSCKTGWETITVPVNPLPITPPIWHN